MGKPGATTTTSNSTKGKKDSITINLQDIIDILRIITILLCLVVVSFVLIYSGVFSASSYLGCVFTTLALLYVILPLTFCYCPWVKQIAVFQTHVDADPTDFDNPSEVKGVRNLRICTPQGVQLGLWHILPSSLLSELKDTPPPTTPTTESFWKTSLLSKPHRGVIIYFHGVSGNRAKQHRKELYQVFQNFDHHIIACDYRGFADSSKVKRITETTVVLDALSVYKWVVLDLLEGRRDVPIYVWGHSMGAGISSHAIAKLYENHPDIQKPSGVVLESPFNNFADELRHHTLLKIWKRLPMFEHLFIHPLKKSDISFQNDKHIGRISAPVLILHAKDDYVIPSHLGRKLFETGSKRRPKHFSPLFFVELNTGRHNEIYKMNEDYFEKVVNLFMNNNNNKDKQGQGSCWHQECSSSSSSSNSSISSSSGSGSYLHPDILCSSCNCSSNGNSNNSL